jgi:hypothetical protein
MKAIALMTFAVLMSTSLAGCIVHTRSSSRSQAVRSRDCPPAHHWDGRGCVHNGQARGHYK